MVQRREKWAKLFIVSLVVVLLFMAAVLALSACQPKTVSLTDGPVPTPIPYSDTASPGVTVDRLTASISRIIDHELGVVCYTRIESIECLSIEGLP